MTKWYCSILIDIFRKNHNSFIERLHPHLLKQKSLFCVGNNKQFVCVLVRVRFVLNKTNFFAIISSFNLVLWRLISKCLIKVIKVCVRFVMNKNIFFFQFNCGLFLLRYVIHTCINYYLSGHHVCGYLSEVLYIWGKTSIEHNHRINVGNNWKIV